MTVLLLQKWTKTKELPTACFKVNPFLAQVALKRSLFPFSLSKVTPAQPKVTSRATCSVPMIVCVFFLYLSFTCTYYILRFGFSRHQIPYPFQFSYVHNSPWNFTLFSILWSYHFLTYSSYLSKWIPLISRWWLNYITTSACFYARRGLLNRSWPCFDIFIYLLPCRIMWVDKSTQSTHTKICKDTHDTPPWLHFVPKNAV